MDFEPDLTSDDPVHILTSSPPSDALLPPTRPTLRSRRAGPPPMPSLSSSPSAPPDSALSSSPPSNVNIPSSPSTDIAHPSPQPSACTISPPSTPISVPKGGEERRGKERKHPPHEHITPSPPSENIAPPSQLEISDFECPLCFQVFFQPVTTTCGHVFCKQCLFRAIKHSSACPLCRYKIDASNSQPKYAVNIVLMNIIEKYFPKEHRERVMEEEDLQKSELPLKPETEEGGALRPSSPSNWGGLLRSTCTVLLSCGGF